MSEDLRGVLTIGIGMVLILLAVLLAYHPVARGIPT